MSNNYSLTNQPLDGLIAAWIYTRVSTEEQAKEEHYSLSAQEEYSMAAIKRREAEGWYYVGTISDPGHSGDSFSRPGLLHLIELVKANKVNAVVVYKRERLFRDANLAASVQALFDLHSVKVLSCVEGLHDSAPHSVLMRQIIDANAQFERANGRKRQHDCLRYAASHGEWKGGKSPFGYLYTKGTRSLVIDPERAQLVTKLFEKVAAGRACYEIAAEWRSIGIRGVPISRSESAGHVAYKTGSDLERMIRAPIYKGVVRVRKKGGEISARLDKNPEWDEYKNLHTPLVSEELWLAANKALNQRKTKPASNYTPRTKNLTGAFQGIIRCDFCDYSMSPGQSTGRGPLGIRHRYYKCLQKQKGGSQSTCTTGQIAAPALESSVHGTLQLLASNPSTFAKEGSADNNTKRRAQVTSIEKEIIEIELEIASARTEVENLLSFVRRGDSSLSIEANAAAQAAKIKMGRLEGERIRLRQISVA